MTQCQKNLQYIIPNENRWIMYIDIIVKFRLILGKQYIVQRTVVQIIK